jgi:hypothetical protein
MRTLLYVLLVCFISCASFTNETIDVKGKYILTSKEAYGELVLSDKNTFKYRYAIGLIDTESKGSWKKMKNEIILLSDSTYQKNKIDVNELHTDANPQINIAFPDKTPVIFANLIINNANDKVYTTNELGKIKLPNDTSVSSFTVHYLGESYTYTVKKGNTFIITLFPDDLSKTYFNNRTFKFKRNKLIDSNNQTYLKNN